MELSEIFKIPDKYNRIHKNITAFVILELKRYVHLRKVENSFSSIRCSSNKEGFSQNKPRYSTDEIDNTLY